MDILKVIVESTKNEIGKKKSLKPIKNLLKTGNEERRDFKKIFKEGSMALIAEIKRSSPSTGTIINGLDIEKFALIYEKSGADGISVVTNEKFFSGRNEDIKIVKSSTSLPVLRKDFIIDEYQIYESCGFCADAILLIACILSPEQLKEFVRLSHKLGMAVIVEVHTTDDLKKALNTDTEIIGINNRNLNNFAVDINISLNLIEKVPERYYTVSESGIKKGEDVRKLKDAGFDGILVGTSILKADDITEKIKELKWSD
uniref:Indole-3-glycerol phosphate synthase n=1 Tax=candidate division WOR-3 bacterium TaxID=2052148 RepID=A0A7V1EIX7_UNCW3